MNNLNRKQYCYGTISAKEYVHENGYIFDGNTIYTAKRRELYTLFVVENGT